MAQATSFAVNDRKSTPVAHTFVPADANGSLAVFREAGAIPAGDRKVTVSMRKTNGKYRVRLVLANPVVVTETINGVNRYKVDRTSFADVTFTFDETSSLQEREDTVGMFANALSDSLTVLDDTITGLNGIY